MILEGNPIPTLVSRYRKLKARYDRTDKEIKDLKAEIASIVETIGEKWTDDQGYAKMVTRKGSVSYAGKDVDRLAKTWSESNDPIMQSCGKMLLGLRTESAGYTYLQVK